VFFPLSTGELGRPASTAWNLARSICKVCPVRLACLDHAIKNRLNEGMWGGKTPEERVTIRNQRRKEAKEEKVYG
jgi:WhiB family redox-sensing transcriptional regulator